jgi:dihydroxyacid dehydratase/phosphogluconate dehydratase
MLHLRDLGLVDTNALTATGNTLDRMLDEWERSERRTRLRAILEERDGVDPAEVIYSPAAAREAGLTGTLAFLTGNLAPDGSVVKATSIDRTLIESGKYHHIGPARVFTSEAAAMAAIKGQGEKSIAPGDVLFLVGCGPSGTGMEETYQLTGALKHLPWGKRVPLVTDARFSGVSTGACIGHVGPDALAGGPVGRLLDDDLVEITIDLTRAEGRLDLVGHEGQSQGIDWGTAELARRKLRPDLAPAAALPADTRLWAALQAASGGTWGGCVYDAESLLTKLGLPH